MSGGAQLDARIPRGVQGRADVSVSGAVVEVAGFVGVAAACVVAACFGVWLSWWCGGVGGGGVAGRVVGCSGFGSGGAAS